MMREGNEHIAWCLRQRRGIALEEPNPTLCNAYIKKAKSSLNMLESADEKGEIEWIATTAYYARYFAFYAMLQKAGITSQIHDCTLSLMRFLFVEEGLLDERSYHELLRAKSLRVDTQYYTTDDIDLPELKKEAGMANAFVLRMEESIERLRPPRIAHMRERLGRVGA